MKPSLFLSSLILLTLSVVAQEIDVPETRYETNLAGVFQGKVLFIQNPYIKSTKEFCVTEIFVNERLQDIKYDLSAIKLSFSELDIYTPVKIRIVHRDSICSPTIVNPEAILFHTIFRFSEISLTDSTLNWQTKGENGRGQFEIEKLSNGIWINQAIIEADGVYEGAKYAYFPDLEEGANKYRIRYTFPAKSRLSYLYSREVEYDYYPEPIEFSPKSTNALIQFSRASQYEIYDAGGTLVLEGEGSEVDVRRLRSGEYVIYFNGKYPGSFTRR